MSIKFTKTKPHETTSIYHLPTAVFFILDKTELIKEWKIITKPMTCYFLYYIKSFFELKIKIIKKKVKLLNLKK